VVLKSGQPFGFQDFQARIAAGQVVFEEGDLGSEMFVIQSGTVELVRKPAGVR